MEEIKVCNICGTQYVLNDNFPEEMTGTFAKLFKYKAGCDCLLKEFEELKKKEDEIIRKEHQHNMKMAKLSKFKAMSIIDNKFNGSKFENSMLDDSHMKLAKVYSEKFIEKNGTNQGILFYGNCGTGKTHATSCIANYLMSNYKTVLILSMSTYLNKLRTEWSEAENKVIELVKECELLIIDDFGTESNTEWVSEKIFNLIDTRYRTNKAIIITTNLNYNKEIEKCDIKKVFGDRIRDRINEMCFPKLVKGTSKRSLNTDEFAEFLK